MKTIMKLQLFMVLLLSLAAAIVGTIKLLKGETDYLEVTFESWAVALAAMGFIMLFHDSPSNRSGLTLDEWDRSVSENAMRTYAAIEAQRQVAANIVRDTRRVEVDAEAYRRAHPELARRHENHDMEELIF